MIHPLALLSVLLILSHPNQTSLNPHNPWENMQATQVQSRSIILKPEDEPLCHTTNSELVLYSAGLNHQVCFFFSFFSFELSQLLECVIAISFHRYMKDRHPGDYPAQKRGNPEKIHTYRQTDIYTHAHTHYILYLYLCVRIYIFVGTLHSFL